MPDIRLKFDEEKHIYKWDSKKVPSVSNIIGATYNGDPWYGLRGTYIHQMAEMVVMETLDERTLHPAISPYFEALMAFLDENPDLKGIIDWKSGQPQKSAFLQLSAYKELWLNGIDQHGRPLRKTQFQTEVRGYHPLLHYCGTIDLIDVPFGITDPSAYLVYLKSDSTYSVKELTGDQHLQDFFVLLSAWQIRKKYSIK